MTAGGGGDVRPAGVQAGPRRSRVVLWTALGAGVVMAVLVAVLASSGPAGQQTGSPLIGRPAPPISGRPLSGGASAGGGPPVTLAGLSGKWVLVNFAASWCVPCQREMPQLLTFAAHHPTGDAVILTVGYDEGDIGGLAGYLRSRHAAWPAVDDADAKVLYGLHGIPESYLVDPAATVVAKYSGGVNAAHLDSFIAQYTPPATGPSGS